MKEDRQMGIRTVSGSFIALLLVGSQAHAVLYTDDLPEKCFINAGAYQDYLANQEAYAWRTNHPYRATQLLTLKKIVIEVTQTQAKAGAPVVLDASASQVPGGGDIFYAWGKDDPGSKATLTVPSDGPDQVALTIFDGVCHHYKSEVIDVVRDRQRTDPAS